MKRHQNRTTSIDRVEQEMLDIVNQRRAISLMSLLELVSTEVPEASAADVARALADLRAKRRLRVGIGSRLTEIA